MTKKETAAFEALQTELRIARALRFTDPVEPDVPIPTSSGVLSKGWLAHTWRDGYRVDIACSDYASHGRGRTDKTDSQEPIRLYSSLLRAMMACRSEMAVACARKLADLDEQIEKLRTANEKHGAQSSTPDGQIEKGKG